MRKAQGMPLNTIIIAVIVLIVLVVLVLIFTGRIRWWGIGLEDCAQRKGIVDNIIEGQMPCDENRDSQFADFNIPNLIKKNKDSTITYCCLAS